MGQVCDALGIILKDAARDERLVLSEAEAIALADRIAATIVAFLAERDRVVRAAVQIARDEQAGGDSTMTGH